MNGPEHYTEAESLLTRAYESSDAATFIAEAQVHATLALAAATAMGAPLDGETDSGLPQRDAQAWWDAAGVKPQKRGDAG